MSPPSHRSRRSLPLRMKLEHADGGSAHEQILRQPFRLGFGEDCDIRLEGGNGPEVVFQVERTRGPLLIANALPPEEFENYIELKVDGQPLRQPLKELQPGARLDILDKSTQRRYQLVVDPARSRHWLRPRHLAIVIAVLVVLGAAFGGYLYSSLRGTQSEVARTAQRVEQAEVALARTARELLESVSRMGSTDAELTQAIRELGRLQASSLQEIRNEFSQAITEIDAQTRAAVTELAKADLAQREKVARDAQIRLDQLRGEFSTRMVESYQQLKAVEQRLLQTVARRFDAREPAQANLKQVLAASREAVLFVRTRYRVRFGTDGEPKELSSLGTGFLVGDKGLSISAQHVLFPWRFDRELLVLERLELAKVIPDSVRWSVWTAGSKVIDDNSPDEAYNDRVSFRSDAPEPGLRMLAAPRPRLTPVMVPSPIGVVELPVPLPGPGDVAVFQIMSFDAPLPRLHLTPGPAVPEALDEVLVVGYPYSRLQDGVAWPQAVRGFVRRASNELMEIDAAVHPGLSGGPILDSAGHVIGMVSAIIGSEVYGVAVRARDLHAALEEARQSVSKEEQRLADMGCDPGPVDGEFDAETLAAYRCESKHAPSR